MTKRIVGCLVVLLGSVVATAAWQTPAQTQQSAAAPQQSAGPKPLMAEDVYKNVEIFRGKRADRLIPAMDALRGLLGVECTHCHTQYDWADESKPTKAKARQHFLMIRFINHTYFNDANAASCWTCHRGQPVPAKYHADDAMNKRVATMMQIPAGSDDKPSEQVFKNIQTLKSVPAGRLPLIMAMFSTSLGVRCDHCHVPGNWAADDKPEKQKARDMLSMASGINGQFYNGSGPVGCMGCHHGQVKPELTSGTPTEAVFTRPAATTTP